MERYFALYPDDEAQAIRHYECNLMLAESLYVSLSVLEVTLRNALCRELETMTSNDAGAAEPEQIYHGGWAAHHGAARADYAVEDSGRTDARLLGVAAEHGV